MEKLLIINPFGIGDCLFTTPVIRAVKEAWPKSFIGFWCNERVIGIIKNDPGVNKIFALSRGDLKKAFDESWFLGIMKGWQLFSGIKKEKFEAVLDFSLDHRYAMVCLAAGIKKRIGFNYKNRGRFLTHKIDIEGYQARHAVEYYLDLLGSLGIEPADKGLRVYLDEKAKSRVNSIFNYAGIKDADLVIGIAPGAGGSWGKDAAKKHWPALKFARLAERLGEELAARIIVLGDEQERPIADIIVNALKAKPLDLVGKTTLEELAAVISRLNLLVSNDGGPLHMAVGLGVKSVSVFGPVDDKVYGPYPASKRHIVIKKDFPCRPCYQNFKLPVCERDKACLKDISADEAFEAVKKLL